MIKTTHMYEPSEDDSGQLTRNSQQLAIHEHQKYYGYSVVDTFTANGVPTVIMINRRGTVNAMITDGLAYYTPVTPY